jgi:hypothetical protein
MSAFDLNGGVLGTNGEKFCYKTYSEGGTWIITKCSGCTEVYVFQALDAGTRTSHLLIRAANGLLVISLHLLVKGDDNARDQLVGSAVFNEFKLLGRF